MDKYERLESEYTALCIMTRYLARFIIWKNKELKREKDELGRFMHRKARMERVFANTPW